MVTPHDGKQPPCIGKRTFFDLFDPGAVHAYRNLMFTFAGGGTGMTTDAFTVIDDESKSHG